MECEIKPIDLNNILIARKLSLLEYDCQKYHINHKEALGRYRKMGIDDHRIWEGHLRQMESYKKIRKLLPDAKVVVGEHLNPRLIRKTSVVIALGGDNFFQYVSHFLEDQPIIGVNSDPQSSDGALLYFHPDMINSLLPKLVDGEYGIEKWTRLWVKINDQSLKQLAVSEVFVGASNRLYMSRYRLCFKGIEEEHKDSGILIATGAGSTGWYRSMASCCHEVVEPFSKVEPEARFICSETYFGKFNKWDFGQGVLKLKDTLDLTWWGHEKGVVAINSQAKYGLSHTIKRGDRVSIGISHQPLIVVKE